jgi:hypothetical protein
MKYLISALLLVTAVAQATPDARRALVESEPHCSNFVRYDQDFIFLGFGPYRGGFELPRKPTWGRLVVKGAELRRELTARDAVVDVVRRGDDLWILTSSGLEKWDLATGTRRGTFDSHPNPTRAGLHEHATGLVPAGDALYVSHGRLGVVRFDLRRERFDRWLPLNDLQAPLESMATGIARSEDRLFVVMDNFSLSNPGEKVAFRGIVTVDPKRFQIVKRQEILDPGATSITVNGDALVVGFYGILWKYSIDTLAREAMPEPETRFWRFPDGAPVGRPAMDERYFYTCFSEGSGSGARQRPVAFERTELSIE